jgi:hypothetical protein
MNILVQDTSWVFLVVLANSSNPYRSQASQRLNNSQHLSCLWTISLGVDLQVYQQKYGEISKTGIKQLEMGQSYIEYHWITISPKMDMLDMLDSWKCPIVLDMLITVILWVCVVLLIHHEFDPSPPKNMAKTNLGESLPLKRKAQRVVRLPIFLNFDWFNLNCFSFVFLWTIFIIPSLTSQFGWWSIVKS